MLKNYSYLGIFLIVFAEINFIFIIQPFAMWYIPIVWYGYILLIDSFVYKKNKSSLITKYPKEFIFLCLLSIPFWMIFELYNVYTMSWIYINYIWYLHLFDFTTIMPAILETFSLLNVYKIGERFDVKKHIKNSNKDKKKLIIYVLILIGILASLFPIINPEIGLPFIWIGLFLLLDPLNYIIKRPSILQKVSIGKKSIMLRIWLSGIIMGFFWEFWNYQAYPKWYYTLPLFYMPQFKLFEMPLTGYLGYLPFAAEVFLFFALFRSFIFKGKNDLIMM